MANLTPERWRRIDEVFQQAADLEGEERAALVDRETAGDAELRAAVERMLEGLGENLIEPAVAGALELLGARVSEGESIGPYRLLERIGRGGMGAVYLALRQGQDFEQRVAVKVLRGELAGPGLAARFSAERRILSALEHPYIARLMDGGTHEGLPYLVMEYVAGQPVDIYCRERGLDVRGRLELFRKICEAVSHAHQRLVVHRDLKPSNILVLPDGTPKLLDFGIAKVLEEAEQESALTETGLRAMTLDYASPEQRRGERIGVASDVYSLGVVLYELLTGERPHDIKREVGATVTAAPSTRVKENARLRRELSGDLDNVLLMALRQEPDRRYASVERFAEDVRRYLEGQTVTARPDTVGYRARKFVRRNRLAVALSAALVAATAAGVFFTVREGQRAQRRFEQVRALANRVVTEFDGEALKLTGSEKLRRMMVDESLKYLDSLAAEAGGDPGLRQELAFAYHRIADIQGYHRMPNLGRRDLALKYHETGLAIEEGLRREGVRNAALLRSLASGYARISELKSRSGDGEGAAKALKNALELADPGDAATYVPVHVQVSREHLYAGRFEEALRHKDLALASAKAMPDPAYRMVLEYERAHLLYLTGRASEAAEAAREGLRTAEVARAAFGREAGFRRREGILLAQLGADLGLRALGLGRPCEAAVEYEKAWRLYLPEEARMAPALAGIGLDWLRSRAACGQDLPAEVVDKVRRLAGSNHDGVAELEMAQAEQDWRAGRREAARRRLRGANVETTALLEMRARLDYAAGDSAAAWAELRRARELRAPALRQPSANVLQHRFEQGMNLAWAVEWGDPSKGLRDELRAVVAGWPEHGLTPALERVRAMAKKSARE